jgi:hypothetical protein
MEEDCWKFDADEERKKNQYLTGGRRSTYTKCEASEVG